MSSSEDEHDEIQLSAEAMKALNEFYEEQNEKLISHCDSDKDVTNVKFDEDWVSFLILYYLYTMCTYYMFMYHTNYIHNFIGSN